MVCIMTQTVEVVQVSFLKLSSIGGTLGLFSGFSLISFVEIVYWIYVSCKRKFWDMVKNGGRMRRQSPMQRATEGSAASSYPVK